jgi:hypothetical protein
MPQRSILDFWCQLLSFCECVLHSVLTESGDSREICFFNLSDGRLLCHRYKGDWPRSYAFFKAGYVCTHTHAFSQSPTHQSRCHQNIYYKTLKLHICQAGKELFPAYFSSLEHNKLSTTGSESILEMGRLKLDEYSFLVRSFADPHHESRFRYSSNTA